MHRSGTSALAGVLNKLGCVLPNALMEASSANVKGFFESTAVRELNDEILASAGSSWDDFLPFNPHWLDSPIAGVFLTRATDLLEQDFGTAPLFVLKDPRICRMVPFWTRVLEELGCNVRPILTVRNPNEVVRSLRQKKGFTGPLSQMVWLRHVLDAEAQTRLMLRYNTSYELLIRHWPQVMIEAEHRLELRWPRGVSQAEIAIDGFLSSELRHHRERTDDLVDNPLLVDWLRHAYAIFTRWAESGESSEDYAALDAIRAAFDESGRAFSRLVQAEREERRLLTERLTELKTEKASLEGSVAQYANAKVDDSRRLRQVEAQAEAAQKALKKREAEVAQVAEISAELTKKITSVKQLQARVATLETDLSAAQESREALEVDLDTIRKQAGADLAARDQSIASLGEGSERLARILETTQAELLTKTQALAAATAEGELRSQEIGALRVAIATKETELSSAEARDEARLAELDALKNELSQVQSALVQRQHESETTAAALREARAELTRESAVAARYAAEVEESRAAQRELHESLQDRFREVATLTQVLMKQQGTIDSLQGEAASLTEKLRDAQGAQESLGTQSAQLGNDLANMTQERDGFAREVHDLRTSTSWRITGPLRRIVLFVRRR